MTTSRSLHKAVYWSTALMASLGCLWKVWTMRWICDDIFITLRYVDHFFRGMGVVFNPGEFVEGYTHPLWLWLLALCRAAGGDPEAWCVYLGVVSCAVVLICVAYWSWRLNPKTWFYLPYTSLVLMLHYDFQIWATSGMETMFFTALLCLAFTIFFLTPINEKARFILAGGLLTAAVATRPDGALFYILANVLIVAVNGWFERGLRKAFGQLCLFNAACLIFFVPYLVWKTSYYGHLLPNTFYAKSGGGLTKWLQGLYFLSTYFTAYISSILVIVAAMVAIIKIIHKFRSSGGGVLAVSTENRDRLFPAVIVALIGIAIYIVVFIVRSGGDFMYARFFVPLMPFIYFLIEWMLVQLFASKPKALLLATALLPASLMIEVPLRDAFLRPPEETYESFIQHRQATRGINDEYWYYTAPIFLGGTMNAIESQRYMGQSLRPYLENTDACILLIGQNTLAFYSRVPFAIEYYGLTDETIARSPSMLGHQESSFIGHERHADPRYLLERGLDIMTFKPEQHHESWRRVRFQTPQGVWVTGVLMTYDRDLWESVKMKWGEKVQLIPFDTVLDDYIINKLPNKQPQDVLRDYWLYRDFYFRHNDDAMRERPFIQYLSEHGLLETKPTPTEQDTP